MSEQDKKSGGSGGSVVMVDVSASSRHKPYRPTELQDEAPPELHKRSKAPAVPSLAEELKNINESDTTATRERTESQSSEKQTNVSKNISSTGKRRGSEEIAMVSLDTKKLASLPSPIPAKVETVVSEVSSIEGEEKADRDKKGDDDSITEEIKELRTADPTTKEHSEWSDDEEAGGLPRSESRASRVSRAVRQLLCCGIAHSAPSEDDIPAREFSAI